MNHHIRPLDNLEREPLVQDVPNDEFDTRDDGTVALGIALGIALGKKQTAPRASVVPVVRLSTTRMAWLPSFTRSLTRAVPRKPQPPVMSQFKLSALPFDARQDLTLVYAVLVLYDLLQHPRHHLASHVVRLQT
ncbi:MAG: hypothetical protein WKF31_12640 [Thermoleophilaceae bacterium]